jgi:hypothetical protein
MFSKKQISILMVALSLGLNQFALAQGTTTLRNPLLPGADSTPPLGTAPDGAPPHPGDGPTHTGGLTYPEQVPLIPSNQIDQGNNFVALPPTSLVSPPGVLGPSLSVPPPPSTPGADPGSLTAPASSFNPAEELNIIPSGGIPGTGGFATTIPTARRGGQQTRQYELRGLNSQIGGGTGDGAQDNVELLGGLAGWGVPYGVPTGSGGAGDPRRNGDGLRNHSIDLGGGMRMGAGPTQALQTTEFGQGLRRVPIFSHKSTDFGFPLTQWSPANVSPQDRHPLLPTAIITNF